MLTIRVRCSAGLIGGIIGGFSAAPGCAIVIWGTVSGISKETQRAIVQPYIVTVQFFSIATLMNKPGGLSWQLIAYAAMLSILIIPANQLGVALFRKMTDLAFRRVVLTLLCCMGLTLIIKSSPGWHELVIDRSWWDGLFQLEIFAAIMALLVEWLSFATALVGSL